MSEWYIQNNGKVYGPVSASQLRHAVEQKKVDGNTLLRKGEDGSWIPASKLKGLIPKRMERVVESPLIQPTRQPEPSSNPFAAPETSYRPPTGINPQHVRYGGFWIRVIAAMIDWFIMAIFAFITGMFVGIAIPDPAVVDLSSKLFGILCPLLYFTVLESSSLQASFGKLAMGLKVTDHHYKRISFGRAVFRFFAEIFSLILLGLGYLMVAIDSRKQGWHDMLAGTYVIYGPGW